MRILKRSALVFGCALAASTMLHASTYNIDFTSMAYGTPVSSGPDVSFSLSNPSGTPAIGGYQGPTYGLSNTEGGFYPTSEFLDVDFTTGVNNVSFTFNNWGTDNGTSFAAYSGGTLVDSGALDSAGYSYVYGTVNVNGSDITSIVFDNNVIGNNWEYAVGDLSYSTASATPEPGSLTLLGSGLLGVCGLVRRKYATRG